MPKMRLSKTLLAAAAFSVAPVLPAANLYWDGGTTDINTAGNGAANGGNGTWNTALKNWDNGPAHVAWVAGDTAVFSGTAGTVAVGAPVTVGGLLFQQNYTLTGTSGAPITLQGSSVALSALAADNSARTATINASLAGSANVAVSGGLVILGGTNSFSGTFTLGSGDLVLNSAGAEDGVASLVLNGGRLLLADPFVGNTATIGSLSGTGGSITTAYGSTAGTRTLSVNQTVDSTYAGGLSDASGGRLLALAKTGSGTLTLSGASTYTGGTTVNAGTLKLGHRNALGAFLGGRPVTQVVVNSGGAVDFNGVTDATYGYTIAGSGVNGTGALTNSGASIGTNFAQASNIRLGANAAIGGAGNWALLTNSYGATSLDLAGFTLTKVGANTISLYNTTVTGGTIAVQSGAISLNSGYTGASTAFDLTGAGAALNVATAASIGSLAGVAGSSVNLAANLTTGGLNTNATFNGNVTGSGALILSGTGVTSFGGSLTNAGGVTTGAAGMTLAPVGMQAVSTVISGAGKLTVAGSGSVSLSAANTYTGGTDVVAGTLVASSTGALGAGAVTVSGGKLVAASAGAMGVGVVTVNTGGTVELANSAALPAITLAGGTLSLAVQGLNYGTISGGALSTATPTLTTFSSDFSPLHATSGQPGALGGSTTAAYTGKIYLTAGTWAFGENFDDGARIMVNGQVLVNDGTWNNPTSGAITIATAGWYDIDVRAFNLGGGTGSAGGSWSGKGIGIRQGGASTDGTLYSAFGVAAAGVKLAASGIASATTAVTLATDSTIEAQDLLGTGGAGTNLTGVVSGSGKLTKTGAGILVLSGSNTFTGAVEVAAGVLRLGNANALGGVVAGTEVKSGASLDLNGQTVAAEALMLNGAGVGDAGALLNSSSTASAWNGAVILATDASVGGAGKITLGGRVSGAGKLIKTGNGELELTNNTNDFSGGTDIRMGTLTVSGLSATGSGPVNIGAAGTFAVNSTGTVNITGAISGAGSFEQKGGTTVLTGSNTYLGATKISGGILQVGNGGTVGQLGFGDIQFTGGTLSFNRSDSVTLNQKITGTTGTLRQENATGTLILGADNSGFAGAVAVQAGTVQVGVAGGTAGSLGTGTTTVSAGAQVVLARSDSYTLANVFAGAGAVTQTQGTAILTANNTLSGAWNITGGTLQVGAGGTTGSLGTGAVVFSPGGVLAFDNAITAANGLVVSNAISSAQAGAGTLRVKAGTVTVTNANANFSGGVRVDTGATLQIDNGTTTTGGLGTATVVVDGTLRFNRGGTTAVSVDSVISGLGGVTVTGGAGAVFTKTNSYAGNTSLVGSTLTLRSDGNLGAGSGSVDLTNGTLVFDRTSDVTIRNKITSTQAGTLIQQGSGKVVLTGDNNYTGQTLIANGVLQLGDGLLAGGIGGSSAQIDAQGTLRYNWTGGAVDSTITGTGVLEQSGTGELFVRSANLQNFGGTLRVSTGSVRFGGGAFLPNAAIAAADIAAAGKLDLNGRNFSANALTGAGELALGAATYTAAGSSTFGGRITGTGGVNIAGGAELTLTGTGSYGGPTVVAAAGRLVLADGGSLTVSPVTVVAGAELVFNRTAASPASFAGAVSGGGSVRSIGSGSAVLTGAVSGVAIENTGTGTLRVTGAGGLLSVHTTDGVTEVSTTGGANVGAVIVDGGTLRLATNTVAGTTTVTGGQATLSGLLQGNVVVTGGVLRVGAGGSDTVSSVQGRVDIAAAGKLQLTAGSSYTLANVFGAGELESLGGAASVVTLLADPSFSGKISLSSGTLRVTTPADLGAVSDLRFNSGTLAVDSAVPVTFAAATAVDGTLSYLNATGQVSFTTLQGTGAIRVRGVALGDITVPAGFAGQVIGDGDVLDLRGVNFAATNFNDTIGITNSSATAATFSVNQVQDGVMSGAIGSPGADNLALIKTGAGTLTLTGANTYTGGTTVTEGTLRVGDNTLGGAGSAGVGGAILVERGATLAFNRADAITVENQISGAGTLAQLGAGLLTLSAPGGVTVGGLIGDGAIRLESSLSLASGNYSGSLSGAGRLTKNDVGTLVLTGDNSTYSGSVALDAGVIQVGAGGLGGSLGTGAVVNRGKLVFNRDGILAVNSLISGVGELIVDGPVTGTVILTAANSYQGKTTVARGTLQVGAGGAAGAIGSGHVLVEGGAAVVFDRADARTLQNVFLGAGSFSQVGDGALTLRGAYGLTGTTRVSGSGGLILDRAAAGATYGGDFEVAAGSTLTFKGTSSATLTKSLAGSGSVVFAGVTGATAGFADVSSKSTVLASDSLGFTGSITVQRGHTLKLGAAGLTPAPRLGAARLVVESGASLRGAGRVAGDVVSSGNLAPGSSPGLLQVGGDFTSTGVLAMEIEGGDVVPGSGDGAGVRYDQVQFGGVATLGGTLALSVTGLAAGEMVTLLKDTAPVAGQNSFSGNFVNVTGVSTGRLVTTSSEILFFNANSLGDLSGVALHDGVDAFAGALSPASGLSHRDFGAFRNVYLASGAAALAKELQNASPVGLASLTALPVAQITRDTDDLRRRAESRALSREALYADADEWVTYLGATGGTLDHDHGASSPTFDTRSFGGVVGVERRLGDDADASVGVRLGYDRGAATLHQGGGKIDQDHARATLYGVTMMGDDAYLSAGLGMGYSTYETKRNTLGGAQKASATGWDVSGAVDAGFLWKLNRDWVLTPHAGVGFVSAKVGGFTEKGSDLALSVDGYSQTSLYTRLGTGLYREWASRNYSRDSLRLGVDIAYEHELLDDTVDITASFANSQQAGGFTSASPAAVSDRLVIGPQAEWMFDEARSISAGYRAQIGFDGSLGHRFDITFEQRF